jgi:hypothetical protein
MPQQQTQWAISSRSLRQDHGGWADQLGTHPNLGMNVRHQLKHPSTRTCLLLKNPGDGSGHSSPRSHWWPKVARNPAAIDAT